MKTNQIVLRAALLAALFCFFSTVATAQKAPAYWNLSDTSAFTAYEAVLSMDTQIVKVNFSSPDFPNGTFTSELTDVRLINDSTICMCLTSTVKGFVSNVYAPQLNVKSDGTISGNYYNVPDCGTAKMTLAAMQAQFKEEKRGAVNFLTGKAVLENIWRVASNFLMAQ